MKSKNKIHHINLENKSTKEKSTRGLIYIQDLIFRQFTCLNNMWALLNILGVGLYSEYNKRSTMKIFKNMSKIIETQNAWEGSLNFKAEFTKILYELNFWKEKVGTFSLWPRSVEEKLKTRDGKNLLRQNKKNIFYNFYGERWGLDLLESSRV